MAGSVPARAHVLNAALEIAGDGDLQQTPVEKLQLADIADFTRRLAPLVRALEALTGGKRVAVDIFVDQLPFLEIEFLRLPGQSFLVRSLFLRFKERADSHCQRHIRHRSTINSLFSS